MLCAALATAGAHKAPGVVSAQAFYDTQGVEVVVRAEGGRQVYRGCVQSVRTVWV